MQEENMPVPENNQENESILPSPNAEKRETDRKTVFTFQNIILVILLIGLAVLYLLFFTSRPSEGNQVQMALQKTGSNPVSIVFINIDTLNENYEYVKVLRNNLESTGKRLQNEVLSEQSTFEKEAEEFQKQVASNTITEEKAKVVYEELMLKQQSLLDKKQRYTRQVADQEMELNLRLLDTITNFLKRYNDNYKFDYILTYKTGGDILIANDTLDITNDVLKQLNQEYLDQKK